MTHCHFKIASKPLKPKNINNNFSIRKFLLDNWNNYFIIYGVKKNVICISATCYRNAKRIFRKQHPHEKIIRLKRI